jgi:hypothetical protein
MFHYNDGDDYAAFLQNDLHLTPSTPSTVTFAGDNNAGSPQSDIHGATSTPSIVTFSPITEPSGSNNSLSLLARMTGLGAFTKRERSKSAPHYATTSSILASLSRQDGFNETHPPFLHTKGSTNKSEYPNDNVDSTKKRKLKKKSTELNDSNTGGNIKERKQQSKGMRKDIRIAGTKLNANYIWKDDVLLSDSQTSERGREMRKEKMHSKERFSSSSRIPISKSKKMRDGDNKIDSKRKATAEHYTSESNKSSLQSQSVDIPCVYTPSIKETETILISKDSNHFKHTKMCLDLSQEVAQDVTSSVDFFKNVKNSASFLESNDFVDEELELRNRELRNEVRELKEKLVALEDNLSKHDAIASDKISALELEKIFLLEALQQERNNVEAKVTRIAELKEEVGNLTQTSRLTEEKQFQEVSIASEKIMDLEEKNQHLSEALRLERNNLETLKTESNRTFSRIYSIIRKKMKEHTEATEKLSFGLQNRVENRLAELDQMMLSSKEMIRHTLSNFVTMKTKVAHVSQQLEEKNQEMNYITSAMTCQKERNERAKNTLETVQKQFQEIRKSLLSTRNCFMDLYKDQRLCFKLTQLVNVSLQQQQETRQVIEKKAKQTALGIESYKNKLSSIEKENRDLVTQINQANEKLERQAHTSMGMVTELEKRVDEAELKVSEKEHEIQCLLDSSSKMRQEVDLLLQEHLHKDKNYKENLETLTDENKNLKHDTQQLLGDLNALCGAIGKVGNFVLPKSGIDSDIENSMLQRLQAINKAMESKFCCSCHTLLKANHLQRSL